MHARVSACIHEGSSGGRAFCRRKSIGRNVPGLLLLETSLPGNDLTFTVKQSSVAFDAAVDIAHKPQRRKESHGPCSQSGPQSVFISCSKPNTKTCRMIGLDCCGVMQACTRTSKRTHERLSARTSVRSRAHTRAHTYTCSCACMHTQPQPQIPRTRKAP